MEVKKKIKVKATKKKIRIKPIALVVLLVLIVAVIGIIYGIRNLWITLKYKEYTEKMYTYGLAELYDNKKATAIQKVTNDEMIKIVLAAVGSNMVSADESLQYAMDMQYTNNITNDNLKNKATKIESAIVLTRALESFQEITTSNVELKMSKSKLAKYTLDEQETIKKAVSLEIIKNKNSSLSDEEIIKGELNKLVVTIIEKYATIYYKSLQAGSNVNLVTDVKKMPENYSKYPYIVDNITTDIYEHEFLVENASNYQTPKEVYKQMGQLFGQIDERIVEYFDSILNVDYTNITSKDFLDSINLNLLYKLEIKDVEEYVEYVKTNKIRLSGKAEPLLPIIYYNGTDYVVRTKLTFKVLNSNTEYNLLFGDEGQTVKYGSKQITMYIDLPMGLTFNSWSLRVRVECLAKNKLANTTSVIIEK